MEDLISVIVPVYNVEEYLTKCVESIIVQTYSNIEIILVDDGSPDRCGQICDEFSTKDSRIIVIHKENGGLSDARNVGIKVSKGNYIIFIDSDDYIAPEFVESLYKSIIDNNADLAICNLLCVDEMGVPLQSFDECSPVQDEVISSVDLMDRISHNLNGWYYVVAWNKIYKRELFKSILFPVGKINEDEFIIHKVLHNCKTVSCISKPLYFYVQRSSSIMNKPYTVKRLDIIEAFLERISFFVQLAKYQEAMYTAKRTMAEFAKAKTSLDMTIPENKIMYRTLTNEFKEMVLRDIICHIPTKEKVAMYIYCFFGITVYKSFCRIYLKLFK